MRCHVPRVVLRQPGFFPGISMQKIKRTAHVRNAWRKQVPTENIDCFGCALLSSCMKSIEVGMGCEEVWIGVERPITLSRNKSDLYPLFVESTGCLTID